MRYKLYIFPSAAQKQTRRKWQTAHVEISRRLGPGNFSDKSYFFHNDRGWKTQLQQGVPLFTAAKLRQSFTLINEFIGTASACHRAARAVYNAGCSFVIAPSHKTAHQHRSSNLTHTNTCARSHKSANTTSTYDVLEWLTEWTSSAAFSAFWLSKLMKQYFVRVRMPRVPYFTILLLSWTQIEGNKS